MTANKLEGTARDMHSCSYYCDRPECVKAQRDELREAYVVRGREYPNEAELAEYKKGLIYMNGYRDAIADMKKYLDSKQ